MSAPRALESFSKQDLVRFIKSRWLDEARVVRELSWIEHDRKWEELTTKMDALHAELAECSPLRDWRRYKELFDQWDAVLRALSRLSKSVS
jgi:hypothetical protein